MMTAKMAQKIFDEICENKLFLIKGHSEWKDKMDEALALLIAKEEEDHDKS